MLRFLQFRQDGVRLHNAANMLCATSPLVGAGDNGAVENPDWTLLCSELGR